MMQLRPYQNEAIDACAREVFKVGRTVCVAPVSSGKSFMIVGAAQRFLKAFPESRILLLVHTREILDQNYQVACSLMPEASKTIFCAGLKSKDLSGQLVFASRDSLGSTKSVNQLSENDFQLVLCDEAHTIPNKTDSRYMKILDAINPNYVIGFTGSPWRLDSGVIWGKGQYFKSCAYNISMKVLRDQGFIVPYVFPKVESVDLSDIKIVRHDYDITQMEAKFSNISVMRKSIEQWIALARDRKCSLFFCCSIAHAELTQKLLSEYGFDLPVITAQTPLPERDGILSQARAGNIKGIINVATLTVGVNVPAIDCIVWLRGTQSTSLYVQIIGRALRTAPNKENALILDFAGNHSYFGSVEEPLVIKKGSKMNRALLQKLLDKYNLEYEGEPGAQKECPDCEAKLHVATKVCLCGHIFIGKIKDLLNQEANGTWKQIRSITQVHSKTKMGEACLIITYNLLEEPYQIKEWLFPQSTEWYKRKKYLERIPQLKTAKQVCVKQNVKNPKYPLITALKS